MIIAVASGKGGTGKTTVATALAQAVAGNGASVSFLDCDVEAPNAHIFLRPDLTERRTVHNLIPEVDEDLCTACGRCGEVCQFHAIVVLGEKTLVFPEMCHGCGSCSLICPEDAITEKPEPLGVLEGGPAVGKIDFAHGILNVGEPMAVPVIAQLKKWNQRMDADIVVLDSPPGASCPVVESVRGADYALLVTEPTPFGLHDLRQAHVLTQEVGVPAGVIINRAGVGDAGVEEYCQQVDLPILMQIPLDRHIGEGIAQGQTLLEIKPEYQSHFRDLYVQIETLVAERGQR
jgi:MinD superfamily P-loop ATPase